MILMTIRAVASQRDKPTPPDKALGLLRQILEAKRANVIEMRKFMHDATKRNK